MKKDAAVIKALAELGLHDKKLSEEEELLLQRALDPEEEFMYNVEKIFTRGNNDESNT